MRGGSLGDLVVSTPSPVRPRGTRSVSLFRHSPVRPATGGQRPPELRGSPAGNLGASPPVLGGVDPRGTWWFSHPRQYDPSGPWLLAQARQYRSPVQVGLRDLVVFNPLASTTGVALGRFTHSRQDKSLFTHCLALLRCFYVSRSLFVLVSQAVTFTVLNPFTS